MRILEYLKPKGFDDIVGQDHLFSKEAVFRKVVDDGAFDALMLIGSPGTGKTTTAELICSHLNLPFFSLHASTSGASDIKTIIDSTKHSGRQAVVFIDEVHRFNKNQQDLLLKVIDGKHAKLIGASTENPYYNLTPPLRSRSFIFKFENLSDEGYDELYKRAELYFREHHKAEKIIRDDADYKHLKELSLGDARRFLNMLEMAAVRGSFNDGVLTLDIKGAKENVTTRTYSEDEHYDLLSAMIKSIRGSDPDAALTWGFKLLESGVSPEEIFRRLLISASEDIGNAYPDALVFTNSAYESFLKVGRPEGDIILSHALTYLASCPKSNRSYSAGKEAREYVRKTNPKVPKHLQTPGNEGEGYKYPFDHGFFVKQKYMNEQKTFYNPAESGFEAKIKDRLTRLWGSEKGYENP